VQELLRFFLSIFDDRKIVIRMLSGNVKSNDFNHSGEIQYLNNLRMLLIQGLSQIKQKQKQKPTKLTRTN